MQLEPGMRVRCVKPDDAAGYWGLVKGGNYVVDEIANGCAYVDGIRFGWFTWRFKPIFRVKMGRCYGYCDGLCNALGCAKT